MQPPLYIRLMSDRKVFRGRFNTTIRHSSTFLEIYLCEHGLDPVAVVDVTQLGVQRVEDVLHSRLDLMNVIENHLLF